MNLRLTIFTISLSGFIAGSSQNSLTGDGFGGRKWYKPYNYTVGSYSGYTVCTDSFQLFGWGQNQYRQLGNGSNVESKIPVLAQGMSNVKFYTCGYIMAVIKCDSTGWVWGKISNTPVTLPELKNVKFADAGSHTVSFVKYDGSVWSLGQNTNGEFGNGKVSTIMKLEPGKMDITSAVRVANSYYAITVLKSDKTVWVCGKNTYGILGNSSPVTTIATSPVQVSNLKGIVDIKSCDYTTIALDSVGNVYQWGKRFGGSFDPQPRLLPGLKNIIAISGCDDGDSFLALDDKGNCYGWGTTRINFGGGLGNTAVDVPEMVMTDAVDILAGELFSYIIARDGSLWASGVAIPIWMNLKDSARKVFTKISPDIAPMELCRAFPFREVQRQDSVFLSSTLGS